MKILGLIPARSGSKGVPDKNVRLLGGKPLMHWTIEAALRSNAFQDVIVSTDSSAYAKTAVQAGAEVPFLRTEILANDSAKSVDVVVSTIASLAKTGRNYDAVCLLQPTTPFRTAEEINLAIGHLRSTDDALVSVREVPAHYNPAWLYKANGTDSLVLYSGDAEPPSQRQGLTPLYFRDGSIYLTRIKTLQEQHSLYGKKLGYCVLQSLPYINIDTLEDWAYAEYIVEPNECS